MSRLRFGSLALGITATLVMIRCGSSDISASLSTALSGLDSLPSVATMIKGTGANGSYANLDAHSFANYPLSLHISGTPPLLTEITNTKVDTYFWNGLLATIKNTTVANITDAMRSAFYGGTVGGPGGHGSCFQAQSVAESFDRMMEAGTSICYMKKIPKASSGMTVTKGGVAASDIFKTDAANRTVKISITGEQNTEDVFIKIYGTTEAGNNYKTDLWFCNSGTIRGFENIRVNKDDGTFTSTHMGKDSWQGSNFIFKSEIGAYLTVDSNGTVAFDANKNRTAEAFFGKVGGSGSDNGLYRGSVVITPADWIYAKRYSSYSFSDYNGNSVKGVDKNYSVSAFSGSSLKKLRFLQAAFKGEGSWGPDSHSYSGASEFQNTHYVAIASSDLKTEADKLTFSGDTFYTSLSTPSYDASAYSCLATTDGEATVDMANPALQAISAECEQDRFRDYNMCWSSDIQTAQQKLNEHF